MRSSCSSSLIVTRIGGSLGYPGPPVHHRGELGERAAAGAALPLLLDVDGDPPPVGRLEVADQAVDVHAVVPGVELGHRPVQADAPAIGLHARGHRRIGHLRPDPVLPRRHHQAGGKALDVPFERPGQRFVEVAQVEREVPLRRGPQAEVKDVRVTAQLDDQPAVGLRRQVAGHDRRGAPVVVPRGERHPVVPDGNELGNPDLVLGQDRAERVVPAIAFLPVPEPAPPGPLPRRLPAGAPFRRSWPAGRVLQREIATSADGTCVMQLHALSAPHRRSPQCAAPHGRIRSPGCRSDSLATPGPA